MNGALTQPSPPRRQQNSRAGGAQTPQASLDGQNAAVKRIRPRTRGSRSGGRPRRYPGKLPGSKLASVTPLTSADVSASEDASSGSSDADNLAGDSAEESDFARQQRFQNVDTGNQYEQLKIKRDAERKDAIAKGLIDDPNKPRSLSEAIHFQGTCLDMCPEFEMHQREYQNNVEKWEIDPSTGRISKSYAVKAFHRPAAGNEQPLPSDVRPPPILVKTLDYLFSTILEGGDDLYSTHAFIRDRTRSIRQDFTLQNYRGKEAIDCHERIARYHILCLHALCDYPNFSEQQEMEQLRKVLQSLMEFYMDTKKSPSPLSLPNETEFRAYFALVFLRDPDVSQQLQTLPSDVFFSSPMMRSLRLRSWAQLSNDKYVQNNAEAAPSSFVRLFKEVRTSTTYLEACILETWFGSIRTSALKALRQALGIKNPQISQLSIPMLVEMLGFDDRDQFIAFCLYLKLEIIDDEETGEPRVVWFKKSTPWEEPVSNLHQFSSSIVEAKRGNLPYQSVVNGLLPRKPNRVVPKPIAKPALASMPLPSFPTLPKIPSIPITKRPQSPPGVKSIATFKGAPATSVPFGFPQPALNRPFPVPQVTVASSKPHPEPQAIVNEAPLTSPVPVRPIKSPILGHHSPPINLTSTLVSGATKEPAWRTIDSQFLPPQPKTSRLAIPQTIPSLPVSLEEPLKPSEKPIIRQSESVARRQSLFERQERLLHDQLKQQERDRQIQLDLEEAQRKEEQERIRQRNRERELIRAKESALLERQRQVTREQRERERLERERQNAERERNIQFYTEEIVDAVVREHIFEVVADVLAVEHYRKGLLWRTLVRIKKVSARSLRRRQIHLEQLRQLRNRKRLLARALNELDSRVVVDSTRRKRRHSSHLPYDNEDELEEVLIRANKASKEAWKPLEIDQLLPSYVDNALTRAGVVHAEWNLLILLNGEDLSNNSRWLRAKLGFPDDDKTNTIWIPSDITQISITWSSVMQFSGSLDNLGALIFVYEGRATTDDLESPSTQAVLHEVVRQITLQSRYRFPLLIINFDKAVSNASDVARELDLQALSHSTTAVPAFQLLTIDDYGNANLATSIRSFFRHITGAPNESSQDVEHAKKRKRDTIGVRSGSQIPTADGSQVVNSVPYNKKMRNGGDLEDGALGSTRSLPKSIESLYESIFNAQKELEAGKALDVEGQWDDLVT